MSRGHDSLAPGALVSVFVVLFRFEDLMEFMDDEVLDPVAALSLNLKDSARLPDPTLC